MLKRGQTAMEFLLTYGWAVLIVLMVLAALFYLGVFDPKTPDVCNIDSPFTCEISLDGNNLYLGLNVPNAVRDVSIDEVKISGVEVTCSDPPAGVVEGKQNVFTCDTQGNTGSLEFGVSYNKVISTIDHTATGSGKFQENSGSGSSNNYGDGSDGERTISINTIINDDTYLIGDETSGNSIINVANAADFSEDDEILIIQIQGASEEIAGTYEFKTIDSINANQITLTSNLQNNYYSGVFNSANPKVTQMIRVPQYTDVTINAGRSIFASSWNGQTGGIVVFRATGTVTVNGNIDVNGVGFRGGIAQTTNDHDGYWGESFSNIYIEDLDQSGNNGGGAGGRYGTDGVTWGGGGTGGGYGTDGVRLAGGHGTYCPALSNTGFYDGGSTYGSANLNKIYFGSGGGSGGKQSSGSVGIGGNGGGIIMIYASDIDIQGNVRSNGNNGGSASPADGCGAGGSGGSIYIKKDSITGQELVTVNGGSGYTSSSNPCGSSTCPSSHGGEGRINIE
ncbi:hypothetical protein K8R47_02825 [archaeon]|nr:hypothetical protein [archaeon]